MNLQSTDLILKCNMGVAGAAIATVLGNVLVMVIVVFVIRKKTHLLSVNPRSISLKSENSFRILALGFPVASGTLLVSVAYMVINNLLKTYDVNAQGAFGICRTIMLLSTITTLLRQGIILIPMMLILNALFGYNGLFFCFAASDIVAAAFGFIYSKMPLPKLICPFFRQY